MASPQQLRRIVGLPTTVLVGIGIAVGSGIFRTPGDVAAELQTPGWIALAWAVGGVIALMQGLITAELSTRFPKAGGEYVYLREAYGDFPAFFFGWAYTIFIVGGSAATIGAAFGNFACSLFDLPPARSGFFAAGLVIVVTALNAAGLRVGAVSQNILTLLKVGALLAVVAVGFAMTPGATPTAAAVATATSIPASQPLTLSLFITAMLPVFWAYTGSSDPVKLAEEVKDVHRTLPRALIGIAVALTLLYVLVTLAIYRLVPPETMTDRDFVIGEAMGRVFGPAAQKVMLAIAMLVCLAAAMSALLATIRVTFALARDGLAPRIFGTMSAQQAPVPALLLVAAFSLLLVVRRDFNQIVNIYIFASAILFGLAYLSLIVFRRREQTFPPNVFRCPAGPVMVVALVAIQAALAVQIVIDRRDDALASLGLLAVIAVGYFVWKRISPSAPA